MSAASQARRLRGPDELEIVAVERGHYASYSACGIPYFVGGVVDELDKLIARTPPSSATGTSTCGCAPRRWRSTWPLGGCASATRTAAPSAGSTTTTS